VNIIVFSKDRGCQLELFLRSLRIHFKKDKHVFVIYKASNESFGKGYEKTKQSEFENITYIEESNFKKDVLSCILHNDPFTVFFTDDDIFIKDFDLENINFKNFKNNEDILCFSLRLNKNLEYCYTLEVDITKRPEFCEFNVFDYRKQQGDYNYPMSLDGHIYRTKEILPILLRLEYQNPNSLERELSKNQISKKLMSCCDYSVIVNNPCCIVQDFCKNKNEGLDPETINKKFLDGYSLSLENISGMTVKAVHTPLPLDFQKFVSVIIPSFNRFELLLNAIQSVKNQTYKNFEIILIDDKSTDYRYAQYNWTNLGVRYFKTEKEFGVCAARNLGISKAKHNILAFLDDDDSWLPTKLEKQIQNIGKCKMSSTEGYYSNSDPTYQITSVYSKYFGEKFKSYIEKVIGTSVIPDIINKTMMFKHNIIATSSIMIEKDLVLKHNGFKIDETRRCEDWPLWLRCLEDTDCFYVNEPLFFYNDTKRERLALIRGTKDLKLNTFAKNVYSQNGEDGILEEILKRLNITGGQFCEFGAWDGKYLSNTYNLLSNPNWSGVYIEGNKEKYLDLLETAKNKKITPICRFVETEGKNSLDNILLETETKTDFEVLSIDIDSYDYQVWESLIYFRPKIVIVEINSSINPLELQTHGNGKQGSSFQSMLILGNKKGYDLVCHNGNMIFVKNDISLNLFQDMNSVSLFDNKWIIKTSPKSVASDSIRVKVQAPSLRVPGYM